MSGGSLSVVRLQNERDLCMNESAIERKFCKYAAKLGIWNCKLGVNGWPDRMFIFPEKLVAFIEFKTPTGRVSERQQVVLEELSKRGVPVFVIRECTLESVYAFANAVDPIRFPSKGS